MKHTARTFLKAIGLASPLVFSVVLAAQHNTKRPEYLVNLINAAASLPPELAADSILKSTEAGCIKERKWQAQILQDAFEYAGRAKYPMPILAASQAADSDVGVRIAALRAGLSKLSLRCRAINSMLDIDPKLAIEMFRSMGAPEVRSLSCANITWGDPGEYFVTARKLIDKGFTIKERREGRDTQFTEEIIRQVSAPGELYPAVRLFYDAPHEQMPRLLAAFSTSLSQMQINDRDATIGEHLLIGNMQAMVKMSVKNGLSPDPMVRAWRGCLMRALGRARCTDDTGETAIRRLVRVFNETVVPSAPGVPRIEDEDSAPGQVEPATKVVMFWENPKEQELLKETREIMLRNGANADDVLRYFDDWKSQVPNNSTTFHEVSITYLALLTAIQQDQEWHKVLQGYVQFLNGAALEQEDPAEWYLEFHRLVTLKPRYDTAARRALIQQDIRALGDGLMNQLIEQGRVRSSCQTANVN